MFGINRLLRFLRTRRLVQSRAILAYWDGQRVRYGDPFAIWRNLTQGEPNLQLLAPYVDQGQEPETSQYLAKVCAAFGVQRWDDATQTGLPDWQIVGLVGQLANYQELVKKNASPGPTSPESMDSESSTGQEPPAETSKSSGDSGSTSTEPKPEGPPT